MEIASLVISDQAEFTSGDGGSLEDYSQTATPTGVCDVDGKNFARPNIRHIAKRRRLSCEMRLRSRELAASGRVDSEFLAVFSHEIRSSVGAIKNAAQMLRMLHAESSATGRARLLIERQVGRMTRFVDDLAEVSRINRADLALTVELIDLRDVLEHAIETVESDLAARNHCFSTSIPNMPIWLSGDATRLEQVFVNLLVNAAKYTDDGGDISLTGLQDGHQAIVRICDTGIGIAPELLPSVFTLFMQADHSLRRAEAGLGIGLALVTRLVELHGGSVTAASAGPGQGSEFTVRLPSV